MNRFLSVAGLTLTWAADIAFQIGNVFDAVAARALDRTYEPNI